MLQYAKTIGVWWLGAILVIATLVGGIPGVLYLVKETGMSPLVSVLLGLLAASLLLNVRQAFVWRDENAAKRSAEARSADAQERAEKAEHRAEEDQGERSAHPRLQLVPEVMRLKVPDHHLADAQLLRAARNQPHFAVVKVMNDGKRNLTSVVPKVDPEGCGAWWKDADSMFVPISEGVPLNVGVDWFLVLAVRYHYPEAPQRDARRDHGSWFPVTAGGRDYADIVAVKDAVSPLGERVGFRVRFLAEGVDQTDHFEALTDDAGNPVFRQTAAPQSPKSS